MDDLIDPAALAKLEDMLAKSGDKGEMPSRKQIMEMLEGADLDDELKDSLKALLNLGAPQVFGSFGSGMLLGIVFVVVIFSILFFFGYKLFKSIKDKEIKREEKKKLKQMKKKK